MQITALVGLNHITGQHVAGGIVLGDDTGQQVALGRDHLGVFVGILVEQGCIGLLDQTTDLLRQTAARLASLIPVVTIFDIGTGDGLVVGSHQVVFDPVLDLVDINFTTPFQLLTHCIGNAGGECRIGLIDRFRRTTDRLCNQLGIEWCATSVTFNHNRFHGFSPLKGQAFASGSPLLGPPPGISSWTQINSAEA